METNGRATRTITRTIFGIAVAALLLSAVPGATALKLAERGDIDVPCDSMQADSGGADECLSEVPSAGAPRANCHVSTTVQVEGGEDTWFRYAWADVNWLPDLPGTYDVTWIVSNFWVFPNGAIAGPVGPYEIGKGSQFTAGLLIGAPIRSSVSPWHDVPDATFVLPEGQSDGTTVHATFQVKITGPWELGPRDNFSNVCGVVFSPP